MLLRAENLGKRFGGVSALEGVSLSLAPAAVHAVIGPNGAGKTTLLNVLSGVYRADTGTIFLGAEDLPHADLFHALRGARRDEVDVIDRCD